MLGDFHGALDRGFRGVEEHQRHSISNWKPDKFSGRFRGLKTLGAPDNLVELSLHLVLFVSEQLRITDDIHEQDVTNLQLGTRG